MMENTMELHRTCHVCQKAITANVNCADFEEWRGGTVMAQNAFPYLSDDERELFFVSGICGKCFDAMFDV